MSKWLALAEGYEELKSTPADIPTKPDKTRPPPKSNRKLGYVGLCLGVGYRGALQNSNRTSRALIQPISASSIIASSVCSGRNVATSLYAECMCLNMCVTNGAESVAMAGSRTVHMEVFSFVFDS